MINIIQGSKRTDLLTLSWTKSFLNYTITLKMVPAADPATPVTLNGTIDGSDETLCHIATVTGNEFVEIGPYECQAKLSLGVNEDIFFLPFNLTVHPQI